MGQPPTQGYSPILLIHAARVRATVLNVILYEESGLSKKAKHIHNDLFLLLPFPTYTSRELNNSTPITNLIHTASLLTQDLYTHIYHVSVSTAYTSTAWNAITEMPVGMFLQRIPSFGVQRFVQDRPTWFRQASHTIAVWSCERVSRRAPAKTTFPSKCTPRHFILFCTR